MSFHSIVVMSIYRASFAARLFCHLRLLTHRHLHLKISALPQFLTHRFRCHHGSLGVPVRNWLHDETLFRHRYIQRQSPCCHDTRHQVWASMSTNSKTQIPQLVISKSSREKKKKKRVSPFFQATSFQLTNQCLCLSFFALDFYHLEFRFRFVQCFYSFFSSFSTFYLHGHDESWFHFSCFVSRALYELSWSLTKSTRLFFISLIPQESPHTWVRDKTNYRTTKMGTTQYEHDHTFNSDIQRPQHCEGEWQNGRDNRTTRLCFFFPSSLFILSLNDFILILRLDDINDTETLYGPNFLRFCSFFYPVCLV